MDLTDLDWSGDCTGTLCLGSMSCCTEIGNGSTNGLTKIGTTDKYASVQEYYGKVLSSSKDLKTSACTAGGRPHPLVLELLRSIPAEVNDRFYGCGNPIPLGISGLRVLDLGSGSGRDVYLCSALVGPRGSVTGVDMTDEQLEVARRNAKVFEASLGYANMRFVKGHMEFLDRAGVADSSVDLIVSNCVVNLSPDKRRVLQEAFRVLAEGGEFYFSGLPWKLPAVQADVYCDRRVSAEARQDEMLWGECISGALYVGDFLSIAKEAGFADPRVLSSGPIQINDPGMRRLLGNAQFHSITYRLFKLPSLLEPACEDYGQVAIYKGSIPGHENRYDLDREHSFETGRPALLCGNTAAMLGEGGKSWLAPHFQVIGNRDVHFGAFPRDEGPPVLQSSQASPPSSAPVAGCCS